VINAWAFLNWGARARAASKSMPMTMIIIVRIHAVKTCRPKWPGIGSVGWLSYEDDCRPNPYRRVLRYSSLNIVMVRFGE